MDLTLFYFIFYLFHFWFSFSLFLILDLGKEYDIMLYVIVTQVTEHDKSVKT